MEGAFLTRKCSKPFNRFETENTCQHCYDKRRAKRASNQQGIHKPQGAPPGTKRCSNKTFCPVTDFKKGHKTCNKHIKEARARALSGGADNSTIASEWLQDAIVQDSVPNPQPEVAIPDVISAVTKPDPHPERIIPPVTEPDPQPEPVPPPGIIVMDFTPQGTGEQADDNVDKLGGRMRQLGLSDNNDPLDLSHCASCNAAAIPEHVCKRCGEVAFCSRTCSRRHWKKGGHKHKCSGRLLGIESSESMEGQTTPSSSDEQLPCCVKCGKKPADKDDVRRCSRCKTVYYCSRHCQKEHWNQSHRKECTLHTCTHSSSAPSSISTTFKACGSQVPAELAEMCLKKCRQCHKPDGLAFTCEKCQLVKYCSLQFSARKSTGNGGIKMNAELGLSHLARLMISVRGKESPKKTPTEPLQNSSRIPIFPSK